MVYIILAATAILVRNSVPAEVELYTGITALQLAGTVSTDVSGTSFLPAIVIPIPLIARTRAKTCTELADQLKTFIVTDESA